jgi:hypothetical protein
VLILLGLTSFVSASNPSAITGFVVDANGPVAGAHVRVQLTDRLTTSASDGSFTLSELESQQPITITAWAAGYYIGWARATPNGQPITITLNRYYTSDNVEYDWFEQVFEQGKLTGSAACGVCHTAYSEWQADAHAQSAVNHRFLTLYSGSDIHGNQSPLSQRNPTTGALEPPDDTQPYYGPGFLIDNPGRAGSCATCHTPMAAKLPNNQNCAWSGCHLSSTVTRAEFLPDILPSPTNLKSDAAEGISCEFCHKLGAVTINDKTGLPYEDSPGILSLRLYRPSQPDHDLFFGPFDDVVRTDIPEARDSYLPLQSASQFCAGCHYGVLGGVVGNMQVTGGVLVYSSFAEWLHSPYSDPQSGKTCQECHMPPVDSEYFVFPERGGTRRAPHQINNHRMLGKNDADFLVNSVSMTVTAQSQRNQLLVKVALVNDQAGHAVPTDSVLHHLILVVEARDADGRLLTLRQGGTLPTWTGDYARLPGGVFAKLLRDKATNEFPSAAFWRESEVAQDTRLSPFVPQVSRYTFTPPAGKAATVEVKLLYRRAFTTLMAQKGWDDPDVVMKQATLMVRANH